MRRLRDLAGGRSDRIETQEQNDYDFDIETFERI